ncbi:hypothetical protein GF324_11175, partial [bacterium]|nr:hypothetical protein [bacterium]
MKRLVLPVFLLLMLSTALQGAPVNETVHRQQASDRGAVTRSVTYDSFGSTVELPQQNSAPVPFVPNHSGLDQTGTTLFTGTEPTGIFNDVAVTVDGSLWAAISYLNNQRLIVFDEEGNELYVQNGTDPQHLAMDELGYHLYYSTTTTLYHLDPVDDFNEVWSTTFDENISDVITDRFGDAVYVLGNARADSVRMYHLDPDDGSVIQTFAAHVDEANSWIGLDIDPSGNFVLATGRYHMYLYDVMNEEVVWDADVSNTEGEARMSMNARVIVAPSNSGVMTVYGRPDLDSDPVELWTYRFRGGTSNWVRCVDVSADGSVIAAGSLQFGGNPYNGYIMVFDTWLGPVPRWTSDTMYDLVEDVKLSDDGLVLAGISWGPLSPATGSDIRVWETSSSEHFFDIEHAGSPNALDLSYDGRWMIVGGKGVHARQFGNGGELFACEIDLEGGFVSGLVSPAAEGIRIEAVGENRSALTDPSGQFLIRHIEPGTYTIQVHEPGYQRTQATGVTVAEGDTTFLAESLDLNEVTDIDPPGNFVAMGGETAIDLAWDEPATPGPALRRGRDDLDALRAVGDAPLATGDEVIELVPSRFIEHPGGGPGELDDVDEYYVYRGFFEEGPFALLDTVAGTATTYTDEFELYPFTTYYYT